MSVGVIASVGSTFRVPPADAVIGGKTVRSISDAPWIAEVMSTGVCSASVIASHWILTAAHCVLDLGGNRLPGYFVVRSLQLGPKDISRWKARTFATLFGYGKHSDKDRQGRQLTKKKVRILSDAKMASLGLVASYVPAVNLGTPGGNGCNGDSGGPLVIGSRAAAKIVGVVSWRHGTCHGGTANVYSEVGYSGRHPLWSWIRSTVLSPAR